MACGTRQTHFIDYVAIQQPVAFGVSQGTPSRGPWQTRRVSSMVWFQCAEPRNAHQGLGLRRSMHTIDSAPKLWTLLQNGFSRLAPACAYHDRACRTRDVVRCRCEPLSRCY